MKFRWKIFFATTIIYIISIVLVGFIVTEGNYYKSLEREINDSVDEETNMSSTIILYLVMNQSQVEAPFDIEDYSQRIVDMFSTEHTYIEVRNDQGTLLHTSSPLKGDIEREELNEALKGNKNYVLKRMGDKHFLFISEVITVQGEKILLSYIKDITYVDLLREDQYDTFIKVGLIGLLLFMVLIGVMSKVIVTPIERLTRAIENIGQGNYQDRVNIKSKDEIGALAQQFNRMASEVEKNIYQLELESQKKQRFIDNLTHELRTPLTSIIGYSDTLMGIKYDEKIFHKSLSYIKSEGNRMLKLVNNLMSLILLRENGVDRQAYSLRHLIDEVGDIMVLRTEDKGIGLETEGEDIVSDIDRDMMKGVLINLVDNAVKASEQGDCITLGIEETDDQLILYVKDTGKGMKPEEIDKVLEPFYRIEKSRSRKVGGAGLGLSICKEIVILHDGALEIESEAGVGTVVKIVLGKQWATDNEKIKRLKESN